jgi:hypothetical protein
MRARCCFCSCVGLHFRLAVECFESGRLTDKTDVRCLCAHACVMERGRHVRTCGVHIECMNGLWWRVVQVWAAGVIVFQMLTGTLRPYGPLLYNQVMVGLIKGLLDLRTSADFPTDPQWHVLVTLAHECLDRDAARRPTAAAARDRLREYLATNSPENQVQRLMVAVAQLTRDKEAASAEVQQLTDTVKHQAAKIEEQAIEIERLTTERQTNAATIKKLEDAVSRVVSAAHCTLNPPMPTNMVRGQPIRMTLTTHNLLGQVVPDVRMQDIVAQWRWYGPTIEETAEVVAVPSRPGHFQVTLAFEVLGPQLFNLQVAGQHVPGSPFVLNVRCTCTRFMRERTHRELGKLDMCSRHTGRMEGEGNKSISDK